MIVVDRVLSPPPPFLQRWHAITRVAGIHYWQAAGLLRALLASTTSKQQKGCEHYWHGKGAGIHFWQAAELDIVGRRLKKDGGFVRCIRLLALLAC